MQFIYNKFSNEEDTIGIKPMFWQFQQEHDHNACISGHITGATDLSIFILI